MRSKVTVLLGSAALALAGVLSPVASASADVERDSALAGTTASGWKLKWADEFNGKSLSSNWRFRPSPATSRVCTREVPELARVSGGALRLSIREDQDPPEVSEDDCPFGQFVGASIGTAHSKKFKYGMFAARIKFDGSVGGHGAFWMQPAAPPAKRSGDPRRDGAEIDVIEYFGDGFRGGGLRNSVHYLEKKDGKLVGIRKDTVGVKTPKKFKKGNVSGSYHVFSVEWTPNEYVYRMDGTVTFRLKRGISRIPQYLILSQISSDWEQLRADSGPEDMDTLIDWVRVYQR